MSATPPPAATAQATPNERLMNLVPEQVGEWKRHALRGARPGPDGQVKPAAEAEFRRQDARVTLSVSEAGALRASPPSTPTERDTGSGTEKFYAQGDAAVRETWRRADGLAEVSLTRADGIVATARGHHVPAEELKALTLGVKASTTAR